MNKVASHVTVAVVALGVGGVAGYFIGVKRTQKEIDETVQVVNNYWGERLAEFAPGPVRLSEDGTFVACDNPGHPAGVISEDGRSFYCSVCEVSYSTETGDILAWVDEPEENTTLVDAASELEDDFPAEAVEVADDFTVEGESAPVDAREFIEKFAQRARDDFGGVSFPGQVGDEQSDAEPADIPVRSVPDFVTVRDPHGPYVISIDEYMDPESDPPFTKVEMRYFAGDGVVVDIRDQVVPLSTIGHKNVDRFGEGTTDPNQVYIRNERLSIDIELTREAGLYVHEVLGQDFPEKSTTRRMRESDDD